MSIQLPFLDQKASDETNQLMNAAILYEKPLSSNNPLFPRRHQGSAAQAIVEKAESPAERKASSLPSIHKNSSQKALAPHQPTNDNLEQNSETLEKAPSNGSLGWRMSVPNYITTIMPQAGQRRSLRVNQSPVLFPLDSKSNMQNPDLNKRRVSNILPIQFMNNFSNYVPAKPQKQDEYNALMSQLIERAGKGSIDDDRSIQSRERLSEDNIGEINDSIKPRLKAQDFVDKRPSSKEGKKIFKITEISPGSRGPVENSMMRSPVKITDVLPSLKGNQSLNNLHNKETPDNKGGRGDYLSTAPDTTSTMTAVPIVNGYTNKRLNPKNELLNSIPEFEHNFSRKLFLPKFNQTAMPFHKRTPSDSSKMSNNSQMIFQPTSTSKNDTQGPYQLSQSYFPVKAQREVTVSPSRDSSSDSASESSSSKSSTANSNSQLNSPPKVLPGALRFHRSFQAEADLAAIKDKRSSMLVEVQHADSDRIEPKKPQSRKSCLLIRGVSEKSSALKSFGKQGLKDRSLKKVKIVAVTKEQRRLRQVLWTLVYPLFLIEKTNKTAQTSEQLMTQNLNLGGKITYFKTLTSGFIKLHCLDSLLKIYKEKKSMIVASNEEKTLFGWKKLDSDDIAKRASLMNTRLRPLLDGLSNAISKDGLPVPVKEFLRAISAENSIIPQNYLFQFELSRLEFNRLGGLRNMTEMRSKMIIGMFFLIRLLIYSFLAHPWDTLPKVPNKGSLKRNLRSCCSVLYHLIMDMFSKNLKIVPDKHMFTTLKSRLQPTKEQLLGFDVVKIEEDVRPDEIITGLYSRKKIRPYMISQNHLVQELKQSLEKLLESLYEAVDN